MILPIESARLADSTGSLIRLVPLLLLHEFDVLYRAGIGQKDADAMSQLSAEHGDGAPWTTTYPYSTLRDPKISLKTLTYLWTQTMPPARRHRTRDTCFWPLMWPSYRTRQFRQTNSSRRNVTTLREKFREGCRYALKFVLVLPLGIYDP